MPIKSDLTIVAGFQEYVAKRETFSVQEPRGDNWWATAVGAKWVSYNRAYEELLVDEKLEHPDQKPMANFKNPSVVKKLVKLYHAFAEDNLSNYPEDATALVYIERDRRRRLGDRRLKVLSPGSYYAKKWTFGPLFRIASTAFTAGIATKGKKIIGDLRGKGKPKPFSGTIRKKNVVRDFTPDQLKSNRVQLVFANLLTEPDLTEHLFQLGASNTDEKQVVEAFIQPAQQMRLDGNFSVSDKRRITTLWKKIVTSENFIEIDACCNTLYNIGGRLNNKTLMRAGERGQLVTSIVYKACQLGGFAGVPKALGFAAVNPALGIAFAVISFASMIFSKKRQQEDVYLTLYKRICQEMREGFVRTWENQKRILNRLRKLEIGLHERLDKGFHGVSRLVKGYAQQQFSEKLDSLIGIVMDCAKDDRLLANICLSKLGQRLHHSYAHMYTNEELNGPRSQHPLFQEIPSSIQSLAARALTHDENIPGRHNQLVNISVFNRVVEGVEGILKHRKLLRHETAEKVSADCLSLATNTHTFIKHIGSSKSLYSGLWEEYKERLSEVQTVLDQRFAHAKSGIKMGQLVKLDHPVLKKLEETVKLTGQYCQLSTTVHKELCAMLTPKQLLAMPIEWKVERSEAEPTGRDVLYGFTAAEDLWINRLLHDLGNRGKLRLVINLDRKIRLQLVGPGNKRRNYSVGPDVGVDSDYWDLFGARVCFFKSVVFENKLLWVHLREVGNGQQSFFGSVLDMEADRWSRLPYTIPCERAIGSYAWKAWFSIRDCELKVIKRDGRNHLSLSYYKRGRVPKLLTFVAPIETPLNLVAIAEKSLQNATGPDVLDTGLADQWLARIKRIVDVPKTIKSKL